MRRSLGIVICSVLFAGCSSGGDGDSASDTSSATAVADTSAATTVPDTVPDTTLAATTVPSTSTTTTVPTCSRPAATTGLEERDIEVDGLLRHVLVYVPAAYDGGDTQLVVDLHGSGSSATEQLTGSRLESVADAHGFIVVAPDAGVSKQVGDDGPTGGVWNVPGVPYVDGSEVAADAPDDVSFLDQLVDQMRDEFCITAVAATGTSGGGRMASALGCYSDRFDLIAPVAGLRISDPCTPAHPVDVIAFHGTADLVNPYNGGGPASWGPMTVPEAATAWAELQGCADAPTTTQVSPAVSSQAWSGCADGTSVELYSVEGGGHNWPGGEDAALAKPEFAAIVGVTTQEISAGELLWERLAAI